MGCQSAENPIMRTFFLTYTGFTDQQGWGGVVVIIAEIVVLRGLQLVAPKLEQLVTTACTVCPSLEEQSTLQGFLAIDPQGLPETRPRGHGRVPTTASRCDSAEQSSQSLQLLHSLVSRKRA